MNKKIKIQKLILITILLLVHGTLAKASNEQNYQNQEIIIKLAENAYAEILPRVELLSGVLTQTSWMLFYGPKDGGNSYFKELNNLFTPYKNHKAIQITEDLMRDGFIYNYPAEFMLKLSQLPDMKKLNGYENDEDIIFQLVREKLDTYRNEMIDLAKKTEFIAYLKENRHILKSYLNEVVENIEINKITDWLEEFYGWSAEEYHLVFSPAMYPSGGYSVSIHTNNGLIVYQIITASDGKGNELKYHGDKKELYELTLHELSHSFVNPSVNKYRKDKLMSELDELYMPVKNIMEKQGYNTFTTFFKETLVRTITAMAMYDIFDHNRWYNHIIKSDIKDGFYLNLYTFQKLRFYQQNRNIYSRFDEFIPYLLEQYLTNKENFIAQTSNIEEEKSKNSGVKAPVVIATNPHNGEIIEVSEEGMELEFSVTYDQKMMRHYAWHDVQSYNFPDKIDNSEMPHWSDDGRTCSVIMKIYPNNDYAIAFNIDGKSGGFMSLAGIPATPYTLKFKTIAVRVGR